MGTSFSENLNKKVSQILFREMNLRMSATSWWSFYLGLNVLMRSFWQALEAESKGVIELKFEQYTNPSGDGQNGQCCDGKWLTCQNNGCDHKFTICLHDDMNG